MTIFIALFITIMGFSAMYCDPILKQGSNNSSLSFSWSTNMSLNVWNENGEEDVIQLRPAGEIGGIRVPCLFDGYLQNDQDGRVAIFGCHGWSKIEIVILSKYSFGSTFNFLPQNKTTQEVIDPYLMNYDVENDYVIFEENKKSQLKRSKRSNIDFPGDEDYLDYQLSGLRIQSSAPQQLPQRIYHNFTAGFDQSLLNKMNGNQTMCRNYVAKIIRLAQTYFLHPSLGIKIFFNVIEDIKYIKNNEFKIDTEGLKKATKVETINPLVIFTFKDDSDSLRGVAYKRKACDVTNGRAIIKWRSNDLKCARTFAHEYGHWFGLYHDSKEDCNNRLGLNETCAGNGVMTDTVNKTEKWSKCSQLRLKRWYLKKGNSCTKDVASCLNLDGQTPCICGRSKKESLCVAQDEICEDSTGICNEILWRDDGRCGLDFPLVNGKPGQCDPTADANEKGPCCSKFGYCGNSNSHCSCASCVNYKEKIWIEDGRSEPGYPLPNEKLWREDGRCGPSFPLPNGEPSQCHQTQDGNPQGPCCSKLGWCGNTDLHCKCPECRIYGGGTSDGKSGNDGRSDGKFGRGQGNCGSHSDCPGYAPVCSEYGFCQCSSYKPGDPACWQQG